MTGKVSPTHMIVKKGSQPKEERSTMKKVPSKKSLLKNKSNAAKLFKQAGLYDLLSSDDQNLIEMQMGDDTANDFIRNFVDQNYDEKIRSRMAIELFRKRFGK